MTITTPAEMSSPSSPLSSALSYTNSTFERSSSPLSCRSRTPTPPPDFRLVTPPPSQDAGEDMHRPRKRRKVERSVRTTQYLDLTSETAQSDYDRREALQTMVRALRGRRKIVVIAGAGISVSAGIPDFRSSHGLFRSLRGEHKLKGSGKQLFDASVYKDADSTSHFHDMVRNLSSMSKDAKPTAFHHLLARLSKERRLLRLYTQNVDGLETQLEPLSTVVPLPHKGPWPQTVQLHGGLEKMTCQKCREIMDFEPELFDGPDTPSCPKCLEQDDIRTNDLGRRSHGVGKLRPRIVLYNEQNPDDEAIGAVSAADMRTRPDAIVVVGTSMKIPGVRRIVSEMCKIVRDRKEGTTIWINPDPEPSGQIFENCWDLVVKGTSDEVANLVRMREWNDPIEEHYDLPQEYTDSDVERVRARQGEVRVNVPTSSQETQDLKKNKAAMTPPRSQQGDERSPRTGGSGQGPTRIRLIVKPLVEVPKLQDLGLGTPADSSSELNPSAKSLKKKDKTSPKKSAKKIKNPASNGKPLTHMLDKENNLANVPSKTAKNATKQRTGVGKGQSKMAFKVTKSAPIQLAATKKEPLSPKRKTEINIQQNALAPNSPPATSEESSPAPQTPPAQTHGMLQYDRRETVSPTGSKPRGMEGLID